MPMPNPMRVFDAAAGWLAVERHRALLYRGALVVGALLTAGGYVTDEQAAVVLGYVSQVLGVGMAAANTSTKKES